MSADWKEGVDRCRFCGKSKAEHSDISSLGDSVTTAPCGGMKAGFSPRIESCASCGAIEGEEHTANCAERIKSPVQVSCRTGPCLSTWLFINEVRVPFKSLSLESTGEGNRLTVVFEDVETR